MLRVCGISRRLKAYGPLTLVYRYLLRMSFNYSPRAMKYHGLTGVSVRSCITCLIWV